MDTRRNILAGLLTGALILSSRMGALGAGYVAHEWGTFTSVQGGDGKLLSWRPLQNSDLPGFVYDWTKPGLGRQSVSMISGKGEMVTLQRMETPVIYFYPSQKMKVDVSVGFPQGLITEWYPQATQIGPSVPLNTNLPAGPTTTESKAVWKNLELIPGAEQAYSHPRLLTDKSGGHYFFARTAAAALVKSFNTDKAFAVEDEKFIFYRGAGSFATPLQVSVNSNSTVVVKNTGAEKLAHLFLVTVRDGKGAFETMKSLAPNATAPWCRLEHSIEDSHIWERTPLAEFQARISKEMESALVSEGLFPDEAAAMVNTWKDSWFAEEGVRVLYVLPRPWTDKTLPMTLNPKPDKLVRVMVGRAEVIPPGIVTGLLQSLTKAQAGDANDRAQAAAQLKALGRFAEPALHLVQSRAPEKQVCELGREILFGRAQSSFE